MATWKVSSGAATAKVESSNALGAIGVALPQLGLSPGSLGRLVCSVQPNGDMEAVDPATGVRVRVEAVREAPAEAAPAPAEAPKPAEDWMDAWLSQGSGDWGAAAPASGELSDARRMEVLFERGSEIAESSDLRGACEVALRLARDLVPADAGAVLVAGGRGLRFVAAAGPQAKRVLDQVVPADKGIAGFVHGFEMGVVIDDAHKDVRHYGGIDRATGYRTQAVLAVPIRGPRSGSLGCLELLNPRRAFTAGDLQVAEGVASALGAWMGRGQD